VDDIDPAELGGGRDETIPAAQEGYFDRGRLCAEVDLLLGRQPRRRFAAPVP
jgi:hypothetical protein